MTIYPQIQQQWKRFQHLFFEDTQCWKILIHSSSANFYGFWKFGIKAIRNYVILGISVCVKLTPRPISPHSDHTALNRWIRADLQRQHQPTQPWDPWKNILSGTILFVHPFPGQLLCDRQYFWPLLLRMKMPLGILCLHIFCSRHLHRRSQHKNLCLKRWLDCYFFVNLTARWFHLKLNRNDVRLLVCRCSISLLPFIFNTYEHIGIFSPDHSTPV